MGDTRNWGEGRVKSHRPMHPLINSTQWPGVTERNPFPNSVTKAVAAVAILGGLDNEWIARNAYFCKRESLWQSMQRIQIKPHSFACCFPCGVVGLSVLHRPTDRMGEDWRVYFYGLLWTVIVLVSRGRGNQFYLFRWPSEDDQEENFINEWNDNLRIKAAVGLLATIRQAQKVHLQPQNTRQVNWKVAWNGQVGVTEDCPIG